MKTFFRQCVIALLSIVLIRAGFNEIDRRCQAQIFPVMFVAGVMVCGGIVILTICKHGGYRKDHTFVLQEKVKVDNNGGYMWINIATNTFSVPPELVYNAFWTWQQTNGPAGRMYRIRVYDPVDDFAGEFPVVDGTNVFCVRYPKP